VDLNCNVPYSLQLLLTGLQFTSSPSRDTYVANKLQQGNTVCVRVCVCVCARVCVCNTSQTVTNCAWPNTWPEVEQNILYDLHFDNAMPHFLLLPISIQSPILLVHHLYPLHICHAPPFLLILSHNQFNLSPPVFSTLVSTSRLFASLSLLPFCSPFSSPLLFSVQFPSSRYGEEYKRRCENGGRNTTVVGKKMERGRKRLKV
jgi:hypothetical protein